MAAKHDHNQVLAAPQSAPADQIKRAYQIDKLAASCYYKGTSPRVGVCLSGAF